MIPEGHPKTSEGWWMLMVIALDDSKSGKVTQWLPKTTEYNPMSPEDD